MDNYFVMFLVAIALVCVGWFGAVLQMQYTLERHPEKFAKVIAKAKWINAEGKERLRAIIRDVRSRVDD